MTRAGSAKVDVLDRVIPSISGNAPVRRETFPWNYQQAALGPAELVLKFSSASCSVSTLVIPSGMAPSP